MVRRLVQNQQVGALEQKACQAQPGLLTAGKHTRKLRPGVCREAHAVQHLFDLGVHIIGVHRVDDGRAVGDFFRQRRIVRVGGKLPLQRVHLLHGIQRRGENKFHRSVDIQRRVQPSVLLQIPGRHTGAERRVSGVRQALPAQNAQKRCLAGAVRTDDADAVAAFHTGVYITQYLVFAEAFAKVLKFQQHSGTSSIPK